MLRVTLINTWQHCERAVRKAFRLIKQRYGAPRQAEGLWSDLQPENDSFQLVTPWPTGKSLTLAQPGQLPGARTVGFR